MNTELEALLSRAKIVFWDFDGVIKESVDIKTNAFKELFLPYDDNVVEAICRHHEGNGGMSRFEKIPLYLSWVGEHITDKNIHFYCNKFSSIVVQRVVDSPWVPGVLELLKSNSKKNVLVTATPYKEIRFILKKLNIDLLFSEIYGAPTNKTEAVSNVLKKLNIDPKKAIMIGDSDSDYKAATENKIEFILRRTNLNKDLQNVCTCSKVDDFLRS